MEYTIDDLKIFCGKVIVDSKLSKQAKLQLLNYVQHEADETQLKLFLLDGKIDRVTEDDAVEIINDRFESSNVLQEGLLKSIFGIVLLSPGGWLLWRGLKAALNDANSKCGVFGIGSERDACLLKAKLQNEQKKIAALQKNACGQSKNPAACKKAVATQVQKAQMKIKKYQGKLQKIQNKGKGMTSKSDPTKGGRMF